MNDSRGVDAISSMCRCMCSGYWDPHSQTRQSLTFEEDPPFSPLHMNDKAMYSINASQALRGVPIREGHLFYIAAEDKVDRVFFSLYINGFTFMKENCKEVSVAFNPFALVRNCKFQSQAVSLQEYKVFKVSMFAQTLCFYFGVTDDEERSTWILDISHTMRLVTQSLFPAFRIRTAPLDHVPMTHRRLMSGYLLYLENDVVSVVYCELQAHFNDRSRIVMYETEACRIMVDEIEISDISICCEKVGINCSCFCINEHTFSSRTLSERKLWLRAFSNVKVKIQNRAPTPTLQQLKQFRHAINEHLGTMMERVDIPLMDALLVKIRPLTTKPPQVEMLQASAHNIHPRSL